MTLVEYVIATIAVGLGALTQGSVGFGFGMVSAPVLALIDERLVPGSVLVLGVTVGSVVAWGERGALDWRGIKWALVGRFLGTLVGAYAVSRLDRDQLAVTLGAFILVAVVLSVAGWRVPPTPSTLLGAGALSGMMGTLTSVGGPPMALVYQREDASKLRSTLAGFFLFGASLALVTLAISGEIGGRELLDGVLLLPGLALGIVAGRRLTSLLDRRGTRPAVLGLSSVAALALVASAVA